MPGNSNSGRRRKPAALNKLDGNPGKREIREEPEFGNIGLVPPDEMLAGMDEAAIAEWNRITPQLEKLGVASIMDANLLASYCISCSIAFKASQDINKNGQTFLMEDRAGNTNVKRNPSVKIFMEASAAAKQLLSEMGLTPTTRSKLVIKAQQEDDPMAALLQRVK